MMTKANAASRYFRDDQQFFVRYALMHPESVSIDSANQFSVTSYRESFPGSRPQIVIDNHLGFGIRRGPKWLNDIGILHCNNMGSSNLYFRY